MIIIMTTTDAEKGLRTDEVRREVGYRDAAHLNKTFHVPEFGTLVQALREHQCLPHYPNREKEIRLVDVSTSIINYLLF